MCLSHMVSYLMAGCLGQAVCYDRFSSPVGLEQRTVWRLEWSWLQHTESSVAAHTTTRESRSTGNKTKQAREEGDASDQEQQRNSCPSRTTSVRFGQGVGHLPVSVTWVGPCQRQEDVDGSIEIMLDEESQRWASWGRVRDKTWTGSDHNKEYWRWYSDWGIQRLQRLLILGSKRDRDLEGMVWVWL